jgi:hypothetical protein
MLLERIEIAERRGIWYGCLEGDIRQKVSQTGLFTQILKARLLRRGKSRTRSRHAFSLLPE